MKIRMVRNFNLIKPGAVLEARQLPGALLDFNRPFQVIEGVFSGVEIPLTHAIALPDDPTYSLAEYTEVHQELLQRREEVAELMKRNELLESQSTKTVNKIRDEYEKKFLIMENAQEKREREWVQKLESAQEVAKVVLPRGVAEAVDFFKRNGRDIDNLISYLAERVNGPNLDVIRNYIIKDGCGFTLISALVNGFTVDPEKTPEGRVLEYFNIITPKGWEFTGDANDPVYIERNAIRTTCRMLGKEVEGLNAGQK